MRTHRIKFKGRLRGITDKKIAAAWNNPAHTVTETAMRLGMDVKTMLAEVCRLRKEGVRIRHVALLHSKTQKVLIEMNG